MLCLIGLLAGLALLAFAQQPAAGAAVVRVITVNGAINPGSADYILAALHQAEAAGDAALLVELDTPGGLVDSTQDIVKAMLDSSVPVVVYVTPSGAHAGSAGVMITLAGHIAVMAPSTRIGAASPVSMSGQMDETMKAKVTNDITGFVESIAKKRGRNVEWAKKAVTQAAVVTDDVAVKDGIVDFVARDVPDILQKADGMTVTLRGDVKRTLALRDARVVRQEMTVRQKIVFHLADPNLVYLFMMIGMLGLYAEFSNPGMVLPGVIGGVALLLFAVSTQILPVNAIGLLLIAGGIALFLLEFKFTSYGALTAGGVALLILGSLFMFDNTPAKVFPSADFQLRASWTVIVPSVLAMGAFTLFVAYKVLRAQVSKGRTGAEGIVGEIGVAATLIDKEGKVQVQGSYWDAVSDESIEKGAKIRVVAADGLSLTVKKL
jgi:membrane-bound serine protease (ClpP class)